jgi:ATP-dependent Clp protease ATP-binding subunit ClpX
VGRVPIRVALEGLDKQSLVEILTQPKNALVKQYQKLFRYDGVGLKFDDEAVDAIADEAYTQKTGARGLRTIMEKAMMDVMFTIPSDDSVQECIITKDVIEGKAQPTIVR